jgi:hypothetical protein
MSLREEIQETFTRAVADDPLWVAIAAAEDNRVELSGELNEALQAVINLFMAAIGGLTESVLRIADEVDGLRRESGCTD